MALKQTNKTNLAQNGHKLEKLPQQDKNLKEMLSTLDENLKQMGPKKCQMNHDNSFDN